MTTEELEAKIKEQDELLKVETAKVDEFRTTNIAMAEKFESIETKFKGVDVDEYLKMQKDVQENKDKEMIGAGKIDELVEQKVNKIRTEQVKKIKDLQANSDSLSTQLNEQVVGSAVKTAAIKAGVIGSAIDDVLMRANSMWTAKDGKPVAMNKDGSVIWVEGTTEPLTIKKWIEGLSDKAPHLFATSTGTGAANSNPNSNAKTITREAFDKMNQADKAAFFKDGGKLV
jgi:hypothetical protein